MTWRFFHKAITESTNRDARDGVANDVFTADFQTAGRGRLDHVWQSRANENLAMSVVLAIGEKGADEVATIPLVVGLSVCEALSRFATNSELAIKWPNDIVTRDKKKMAGILCERNAENIIAGIGINVNQTIFSRDISSRATSLAKEVNREFVIRDIRDAVLNELAINIRQWRENGFASLLSRIQSRDCLKNREVAILQNDFDREPIVGHCDGVASDGSLIVASTRIYSGEAHIKSW